MDYKQANTEWMKGSFGISLHWTAETKASQGETVPFKEAVNAFEPDRIIQFLKQTGSTHFIFTLTHALQQIPAPHPKIDALLPGRTTRRDLIGELIEAAEKEKIHFIAYYNHSCNGTDDPAWKKASGYKDGDLNEFASNILQIVELLARRYGKKLSGWWFDSGYTVDMRGPHKSATRELGDWHFPWEALSAAAKAGNPDAAVTFNAGTADMRFLYSSHQDYYAGETQLLDRNYKGEKLVMQDHRWTCMEPEWVYKEKRAPFAHPRFEESEYRDFIGKHTAHGTMVTLNIAVDQSGLMNPESCGMIRRIRQAAEEGNVPMHQKHEK